LATRVKKADNFFTRIVGLLKRHGLGPEEALWLVPSKGIHTIGMKFPIDVIFLDRMNVVQRLIPALDPYRVTRIQLKTYSILELPKGSIGKSLTQVGDKFDISLAETSEMDDLKESRLTQLR
jgi:uncharacterized membrane protein (UPF0127 family)